MATRDETRLLDHAVGQLADPAGFLDEVRRLYGNDEERYDLLRLKDDRILERFTRPLRLDGRRARLWSFRDITEESHARRALEAERTRLRTLVRTIPDLVWLKDPDGVYLACNQVFEQFLGAEEAAIVGKTDHDFVAPELADFFGERDRAARAAGRPCVNEEWLAFAADGYRGLFETVKTPMYDEAGRLAGVLGIARDITQARAAQDALRESESRYRSLFETMAQGVVYQDTQGRIVSANPAAERILGRPLEDLRGRDSEDPEWRAVREDGSAFPSAEHPSQVALHTGQAVRNVAMGIHNPRQGGRVWLNVNAMPEFRPGETVPYRVYATFEDITDRKRVEQRERVRADILEKMAGGMALPALLDRLARAVETEMPNILCSILLLDASGRCLRHGAAPSLPEFYNRAIDGLAIGPEVGSCGAAAYTGRRILVENIGTHPHWMQSRELAARAGLATCWSEPILGSRGEVLGTFALYYRECRAPDPYAFELITQSAHLAGIAIERDASERALREREEIYRAIVSHAADGIVLIDTETLHFVEFNAAACADLGYTREEFAALTLFDLQADLTPEELRQRVAAMLKERFALEFEHRHRRKDGTARDVLVANSRVRIRGRDYFAAIWRDITAKKQSEARLRASEAALNEAQAIARLGSWTVDLRDGRLLWSAETHRLFGIPPGTALTLDDFFARVHPEDREPVQAAWNVALGGAPYDIEHRIVVADDILWVRERAEIRRDGAGVPYFAVGTTQDITERKQAAEKLRQSELRLKFALEGSGQGVWDWHIPSGDVYMSPRWKTMIGYAENELADRVEEWETRLHPEDKPGVMATLNAYLDQTLPEFSVEFRLRRRDGGYLWILGRGITVERGTDGRPIRMIGVHIDIDARKRAEAELERYRHHLEELVAERTAGLEAANRRLRLSDTRLKAMFAMSQQANQMDERALLQLGIDEAVRLTGSEIGYLHFVNDDQETLELVTWSKSTLTHCTAAHDSHYPISAAGVWADSLRRGGPVVHNDYQNLAGRKGYPEGHTHLIRHLGVPVIEGDKTRVLLGVGNKPTDYDEADLHELQLIGNDLWRIIMRRRAELALARAKEAAETASRAKSVFLANMSHEIRTPMNVIIGLTHLLRRGAADPRQAEQLRKISEAAHHLLAIINDILDISKIEAGKLVLDDGEMDLENLLTKVCTLVSEKAERKGLEVVNDIDPALLGRFRGDALRLGQVLLNFAGNAVKFTERGLIVLRARQLDAGDAGVLVRFEVQDTGIGIAPEDQERLFQAFEQVDSSITRKYGGTGLGLTISRRLAELMSGRLGVDSAPGLGSTFWFEVRLRKSPGPARPRRLALEFTEQRTLVVDDLPEARTVLGGLLRELGFQIELAESGAEALAMIEAADRTEAPFTLVLLDWRMPELDGVATAVRLKALPLKNPPAYLLVTAFGGLVPADQIEQAGFDAVLAKPVTPSGLLDTLLTVLHRHEGEHPAWPVTPPPLSAAEQTLARRHRGARLLLAEDNPLNREVALELLRGVGLVIDVAENGAEAVTLAQRHGYDLILMDVQMPVLDGLGAARLIRALPDREATPILAMTANAFEEDRLRCLEAGMNDHIGKPVDPEILFATLLKWLPAREAEPAATPPDSPDSPAAETRTENEWLRRLEGIAGLDAGQGLKYLCGKTAAYARLLHGYAERHRDDIVALRQHLATGEAIEAQRLAHSLKSASASLGAVRVRDLAAHLETALREHHASDDIAHWADALESELASLATTLLALPDWPESPEEPVAAGADIKPVVDRLAALLAQDDLEANTVFQEAVPVLRKALGHKALEIGQLIEAFEYEQALALLSALLAISPSGPSSPPPARTGAETPGTGSG